MRAAIVLAMLTLVSATDANAQQWPVQPGQRVRVWYGLTELEGLVQPWRGDTLVVRGDSLMRCPPGSVTRLEVHRGRKSNWDKGLAVGATAGGFVGLMVGVLLSVCNDGLLCPETTSEKLQVLASGVVIGSLIGGVPGMMIGALSHRNVWREVPPERFRVTVVPRRDGVGLGATIAF